MASVGARLNPDIENVAGEERAMHADIRIANSIWGPFFDEVITSPAKYGIMGTTKECARRSFSNNSEVACAAPNAHFNYHRPLLSVAAHRALGEMLFIGKQSPKFPASDSHRPHRYTRRWQRERGPVFAAHPLSHRGPARLLLPGQGKCDTSVHDSVLGFALQPVIGSGHAKP